MSTTVSAGIYGLRYWIFMAKAMSRRLDKAVETGQIEPDAFPAGIYEDAKMFFDLVKESFGERTSIYLPSSMHVYSIASDIVRDYSEIFEKQGRDKIQEILARHVEFCDSLNDSRVLDEDELQRARELSRFFMRLARAGEAERYQNAVRLSFSRDLTASLILRHRHHLRLSEKAASFLFGC